MRDKAAGPAYVSVAESSSGDALVAAEEIARQIDLAKTRFVIVFAPQGLDLEQLARALDMSMQGVPIFGCTSAGQIGTQGYESDVLLAIAFPKAHFRCASVLIEPLKPLSIPTIVEVTQKHLSRFPQTAGWNRLAVVLSDGLSKQEDILASTLAIVLEGLPVFGGSAGDGLRFGKTYVLHQGRFHPNAALLLVLETDLEFQTVSFDHFMPTDVQLVITDADPEERVVYEINGAPAADEYARLIGCEVKDLNPNIFAENPLLVCHQNSHYVRAIGDATSEQALSFLAAIDDGLIMTLGRGKEVIETLKAGLSVTGRQHTQADFILGFDCVLRRLELVNKGLDGHVSELLREHRVIGFNTYGEQHHGLHMNQTFLGVAFFEPDGRRAVL